MTFTILKLQGITIPTYISSNFLKKSDFLKKQAWNKLVVASKLISKNVILIRKKFRNEIPMILYENPRIYSKSSRIIRIKSVLNSYCCPNWVKWTPTNCIRCSVNGSYVGSRTLSRVPELVMLFRSFYLNIIYGQLTWCLFKCKINWPKIKMVYGFCIWNSTWKNSKLGFKI